jgi:hypothetical protein
LLTLRDSKLVKITRPRDFVVVEKLKQQNHKMES